MPTMPSRPSTGAAAPSRDASRSPAPPDEAVAPASGRQGPAAPRTERTRQRRPRIVVTGAPTAEPTDYPVQLSKVQAPPLREDILARDRLLDWLSVKVHSRVVLLVAEAGYGKTTLLADFSRRTRIRVLWFRLDRGDRDWVGFIAHLVAAVRVHVPGFGTTTSSLLRESTTTSLSLDAVLDAFLRELSALPNDPSAIVFDDVHLVDDSADVKHILRELLARSPDRMSFVFASRREPPVRLARLRALGEVAELVTDDLRFDAAETERLFRETYEMALEPSVLAELGRRTEGWAASLQLVRSALHDRDAVQVRTFISSLSGAEGHLYEYLAEEVIGDLPADLQHFLMRTSVLDTVDLTLGSVAAGISEQETRAYIDEAERYGLLGRRGSQTRHLVRAHPLVRDFLKARLLRSEGATRIKEIHALVARKAELVDWEVAARHYRASGDDDEARRVVSESIEPILARGSYAAAQEISSSMEQGLQGLAGLVLESRLAQQRGASQEAVALAERASNIEPLSPAAIVNLTAARDIAGDVDGAIEAIRTLASSDRPHFASLARSVISKFAATVDGSLEVADRDLLDVVSRFDVHGAGHYLGVAHLNRSIIQLARGDFSSALEASSLAIGLLDSSSAGIELVSAHIAHASATAFAGDIVTARKELRYAEEHVSAGQEVELAADVAELEALIGESSRAWPLVSGVADHATADNAVGEQLLFARALLSLRDGDLNAARLDISRFHHLRPASTIAFEVKRLIAEGLLAALSSDESVPVEAVNGTRLAEAQGAHLWTAIGRTLIALADRPNDPSEAVVKAASDMPSAISCLTELVLNRLSDLGPVAYAAVLEEAERRPWRWRGATRNALERAHQPELQRIADLLGRIGEGEDIGRLRDAGRRGRTGARFGAALARRLAERVFVEDLGRVHLTVGTRTVDGADVRRKVMALMCLLLSRPKFSATREEVLDSLWPEHDPASALNSLNQTVYFLRRVFEPEFRDDRTPGYVGQDGETIWLDTELIDCRSRRCVQLIRTMPGDPTPEGAVELATQYRGRFALDFAYDDWAAPFRDALHASYLRVIERAVRLDLDSGHFERGTFIAERAAEVDPDSEEIQAALVRLYRLSSAHAAAAEQYAHYARNLRELGIEPPALVDV
jgi:ATP/maltotriose-dependent transcriptional regulator MalT/DNA-binding SARP family transcriptional activator